jgi:hypothetical protein
MLLRCLQAVVRFGFISSEDGGQPRPNWPQCPAKPGSGGGSGAPRGAPGLLGLGQGGGVFIYTPASVCLDAITLANNQVSGGSGSTYGGSAGGGNGPPNHHLRAKKYCAPSSYTMKIRRAMAYFHGI